MNALVKYLQEQSLLLRVPVELNQQFESWVEGLVELDVDIEIFDDGCGVMVVNEAVFRVRLCTLPHHVETFKTFDDHLYYQSGDLHQVLVVEGGEFPSLDLYQKDMRSILAEPEHIHYTPDKQTIDSFAHEKGFGGLVYNSQLPHGLTAPLRHVVQRAVNTKIDPPPEIVSEAELVFTRMEPNETTYVTEYDVITKNEAMRLQHEVDKAYQVSLEGQREKDALQTTMLAHRDIHDDSDVSDEVVDGDDEDSTKGPDFGFLSWTQPTPAAATTAAAATTPGTSVTTSTPAPTSVQTVKPEPTPVTAQTGGGTTGGIHQKSDGSMSALLHQGPGGSLSPGAAQLVFTGTTGTSGDVQPLDQFVNPNPANFDFFSQMLPSLPDGIPGGDMGMNMPMGVGMNVEGTMGTIGPNITHNSNNNNNNNNGSVGGGVGGGLQINPLDNLGQFGSLPSLPDIDLSTIKLDMHGTGMGLGNGAGLQTIADLEVAQLPSMDQNTGNLDQIGAQTRMSDLYQGLGGTTNELQRDLVEEMGPLDSGMQQQSQQQQSQQQHSQQGGGDSSQAMSPNLNTPAVGGANMSSSFQMGTESIDMGTTTGSLGSIDMMTPGSLHNQMDNIDAIDATPIPQQGQFTPGIDGTTTTPIETDPTGADTTTIPVPPAASEENPEFLRLQQVVNDAAAASAAADAKIGTGVNPIQNKQFQNAAKAAKDKLAQAQAALDAYR